MCSGAPRFEAPTAYLSTLGLVDLAFKWEGEQRGLKVMFRCDKECHSKLPGPKLVLSLGGWGHGVEIMLVALTALADEGELWMRSDYSASDLWHQVYPAPAV